MLKNKNDKIAEHAPHKLRHLALESLFHCESQINNYWILWHAFYYFTTHILVSLLIKIFLFVIFFYFFSVFWSQLSSCIFMFHSNNSFFLLSISLSLSITRFSIKQSAISTWINWTFVALIHNKSRNSICHFQFFIYFSSQFNRD